MNIYNDALPVDEEWAQEHDGEQWAFLVGISLYDLVDIDGIDGLNEHCDNVTGVVLTEIGYAVAHNEPDTIPDPNWVLLLATGYVSANG